MTNKEYIERKELLGTERLLDTDIIRKSKTASWLYDQMIHDIENAPAADVVEVVRCKDCVHYTEIVPQHKYKGRTAKHCIWHSRIVSEDGYCDQGLRRTENDKGTI